MINHKNQSRFFFLFLQIIHFESNFVVLLFYAVRMTSLLYSFDDQTEETQNLVLFSSPPMVFPRNMCCSLFLFFKSKTESIDQKLEVIMDRLQRLSHDGVGAPQELLCHVAKKGLVVFHQTRIPLKSHWFFLSSYQSLLAILSPFGLWPCVILFS